MKARDLRQLSTAELKERLEEARRELFNLRFRLAMRQLDNHRAIPRTKRTIARILTLLRERELAEEIQSEE